MPHPLTTTLLACAFLLALIQSTTGAAIIAGMGLGLQIVVFLLDALGDGDDDGTR